MILAKRIFAIREYAKLNISEFSRVVGFKTPQTVRELENGRTKNLSFEAATKILTAYPEINKEWLETGVGEMLNPVSHKPLIDIKNVEDSFNDSNVLDKFLGIIREKDKQIEELNKRIAQLTDKLLGL